MHSLADAKTTRKAIRSLDVSVAIDIAMTETARECDYVLPTHTQYEKWEGTFFPRKYPSSFYHLRAPIIEKDKSKGSDTLPEAEIHSRLIDKLGTIKPRQLWLLKLAAKAGLRAYTLAFMLHLTLNPKLAGLASYILYKTLGPVLPEGQEATAAVWGIAQSYARKHQKPLERIGLHGLFSGTKLFQKIVSAPNGTIIGRSEYEDSFSSIPHKDNKIQLVIGELLDELETLKEMQPLIRPETDYPFALAAGSRTAYTANCNIRDPRWAKGKNVTAMSVHPLDAASQNLNEGDEVLLETKTGSVKVSLCYDERMHRGTLSIPNGQGMAFCDENGQEMATGVFINELTAADHRDKFIGTPLHKYVPAKISRLAI